MTPEEIRKQVLLTLIENYVGNREASRESLCIAIDAHNLLSDKKLEDTYKDRQLKSIYSHLLPPKTELEKASEDKTKPIAIYEESEALKYYNSPAEVREAWDWYAQEEADIQSKRLFPGETITARYMWTPPLSFTEWLDKKTNNSRSKWRQKLFDRG